MKRFSVACGALALGHVGGSAVAADLPMKAPVVPIFSWTGPYIGVNIGYGWGTETVSGAVTGTATLVEVVTPRLRYRYPGEVH